MSVWNPSFDDRRAVRVSSIWVQEAASFLNPGQLDLGMGVVGKGIDGPLGNSWTDATMESACYRGSNYVVSKVGLGLLEWTCILPPIGAP